MTTRFPVPSAEAGYATAIDSLGRIIVAGYTYNGSNYDFAVVRLTPAGALDQTFGAMGAATVPFTDSDVAFSVAVDSLNRIVIAGSTGSPQDSDFAVARLTTAGVLDVSFDGDGKQTIDFNGASDFAYGVAIDSQNRVIVAGNSNDGSSSDFVTARLTAAGTPDTSFDGDGRQKIDFAASFDEAHGVAVDPSDRIVLVGYTYNGSNSDFAVARLTTTGALDSGFDGDGKQVFEFGSASGEVAQAVSIDSQNRIVVTGSTANGFSLDLAVARLTSAGALDGSFDSDGKQSIDFGSADEGAQDVAIDSGDRIVVAGFTGNGANYDFAVARLTSAGALDGSFDGDGKQTIDFGSADNNAYGVVLDSQGRIDIGGYANGLTRDIAVARLTSIGALDAGFDFDGKQSVDLTAQSLATGTSVAVDSLGRVLVAGYDEYRDGFAVSRYSPAGALDTTYGAAGTVRFSIGTVVGFDRALSVAVDSQDRVIVAGWADLGNYNFAVARLTTNGVLDTSFDGDGKQTIAFGTSSDYGYAVAIDSLDRIVVAGSTQAAGNDEFAVARLTVSGALDTSFDGDGQQTFSFNVFFAGARAVAIDSLDRIIVAGNTYNGVDNDFAVARITVAGALDSTFDGDGKQTVAFGPSNDVAFGVAVDSLDRVVVAGYTSDNGSSFAVVRFTTAGAFDASFDGDGKQIVDFGVDDQAYGVAVDSLNRIVLAGQTYTSNSDFAIARLSPTGALDPSFDSDGKQTFAFGTHDDIAYGVTIGSADRVVLAGFSDYDGKVFALARLTGDTTTASAQVNDGAVQRSMVTSLTVTFSSQVTFTGLVKDAFTLVHNGGKPVTFTATTSVVNGATVVTLSNFSGNETQFGSLRDGRYTLTALASQISAGGQALDGDADGTPGGNFVFGDADGLFRYFGDINGDRHVDIADFGLFSTTYGLHTGQTGFLAAFDFNGDGVIDIADFGQFAIRMFTVLP